MNFNDLLYIIIAAALVWYWLDGMRCKELAHQAGKNACKAAGVLFLDDSVAIDKVRLKRNDYGQFSLFRIFYFEFTNNGEQRSHGEVHILGKKIIKTTMDAYRI